MCQRCGECLATSSGTFHEAYAGVDHEDAFARAAFGGKVPHQVPLIRKELDLPGIYILFGEGEDEAKPIVYIGQTEDARTRLESHNRRRTFWKAAIFFVSKTQNFTQVPIRYLE